MRTSSAQVTTKPCRVCLVPLPTTEFYSRNGTQDGLRSECKSCTKSRTRSYAIANPEQAAEHKRAWAAKYAKAQKRAWYDNNRTHAIAKARQWVIDNPERRQATWRAWYATNPTSRHAAAQRRRAHLVGADVRIVTEKEWLRLVARYGYLCAYCRLAPATHRDHVIPISRGGRHAIGNLLPACQGCNLSKKARLLVEWRQ